MNDKCAAGTGRFFEVMVRVLEVDLDDFGRLALKASQCIPISSVCTVFAESEVVSLVAQGEEVANILAGLCRAAAERVRKLAQKVGVTPQVTLTGGWPKTSAFKNAIQELLDTKVNVPDEPWIVGALGTALIGLDGLE